MTASKVASPPNRRFFHSTQLRQAKKLADLSGRGATPLWVVRERRIRRRNSTIEHSVARALRYFCIMEGALKQRRILVNYSDPSTTKRFTDASDPSAKSEEARGGQNFSLTPHTACPRQRSFSLSDHCPIRFSQGSETVFRRRLCRSL
jgi:hypothetical protein